MSTEIAKSYELIGRVFATLIAVGLRRTDLDAEDFGSAEDDEEASFFEDVMLFLEEEGFVRSSTQQIDGARLGVQLTSRGLAAAEDGRLAEGKTVRAEVEKKGELSSATYGKIGSFIGGLLGGSVKALGS